MENSLPATEAGVHEGGALNFKSTKFLSTMEMPNNFYNQYSEEMEVSSTPCTPSLTTSSTEFSEIQTISESIMLTSEQCKLKLQARQVFLVQGKVKNIFKILVLS